MSNFCLKKGQGLKILAAHLFGHPLLSKRTSLECPQEPLWLLVPGSIVGLCPTWGRNAWRTPNNVCVGGYISVSLRNPQMAVNIKDFYGNSGNRFKKRNLAGIFNKKHFTPVTPVICLAGLSPVVVDTTARGRGYFRNFWVRMCCWDPGTLNLYQS